MEKGQIQNLETPSNQDLQDEVENLQNQINQMQEADKMMRMAVRGEDGTAKAAKGDNQGRLEVKTGVNRRIMEETLIPRGEQVTTDELNSLDYPYGKLVLKFDHNRYIKLSIAYVDSGNNERREELFNGHALNGSLSVSYEIKADRYYFIIEALDVGTSSGVNIHSNSFETLMNNESLDKNINETNEHLDDIKSLINPPFINRRLMEETLILRGESHRTDLLNSNGYPYGEFNLLFDNSRYIRINIVYVLSGGREVKEELFNGFGVDGNIKVRYNIKMQRYLFEIEALDKGTSSGVNVHSTSFEVLSSTPYLSDIQSSLDDMSEKLNAIASQSNSNASINSMRSLKYPSDSLVLKESPIDVHVMTIGTDDYIYVVDTDGVLKKYESITSDDPEPVETGITWDFEEKGLIVYLFVAGDGIVFFSYTSSGGDRTKVYRSDDMDSEPQLVYEGPEDVESRWTRNFGVDRYYNGTSYFIAGNYYTGGVPEQRMQERELILSKDGGRTFDVVKKTVNNDSGGMHNSHWHDARFDIYHGLLWASQGDGTKNNRIFYSEDFGETWVTLADDLQPTSITPYPDRVIFGRDTPTHGVDGEIEIAGFDFLYYPSSIRHLKRDLIMPFREINTLYSTWYHNKRTATYKNESYMNFSLKNNETPVIMASGDYGHSWHGIWMGIGRYAIDKIVGIDEKYVYIYKDRLRDGNDTVLYAEKPEWI